jgi:hypothetical protein
MRTSASVMSFPSAWEANPHWGEMHSLVRKTSQLPHASEPTNQSDNAPLKSLLLSLSGALGKELGGLLDALDQILLLLHDGELGSHKSEHGRLGDGEVGKGL